MILFWVRIQTRPLLCPQCRAQAMVGLLQATEWRRAGWRGGASSQVSMPSEAAAAPLPLSHRLSLRLLPVQAGRKVSGGRFCLAGATCHSGITLHIYAPGTGPPQGPRMHSALFTHLRGLPSPPSPGTSRVCLVSRPRCAHPRGGLPPSGNPSAGPLPKDFVSGGCWAFTLWSEVIL